MTCCDPAAALNRSPQKWSDELTASLQELTRKAVLSSDILQILTLLKANPTGSLRTLRLLASGVLLGILIGLLILAPNSPRIAPPATCDLACQLSDAGQLCPDEIQILIFSALKTLNERQGLGTDGEAVADVRSRDRGGASLMGAQQGIRNMRRLLPSVKRWTSEALRGAVTGYDPRPLAWSRIDRLIDGVHRIVPDDHLLGVAGIRDDRLSEILVDPVSALDLNSDDEAVFVLAHELVHAAARSGELTQFMNGAADSVRRRANVEPAENQREDLACDLVAELVLRRFITDNPTREPVTARLSRVLGYESPAERFARAWEDFCESYSGDPGDDSHLNQYQTIRALLALDPELASLMPPLGNIPAK